MKRNISPLYSFRVDSTGIWIAPIDQMPYAKYKPFNYLIIENKDMNDVTVTINGSMKKRVPSGTIMELEAPTIPNIFELRVEGQADQNTVEVSIQKIPDLRSILYKAVGWLK